ncbi:NF-kappa-B essential modulator isoform X3 [Drosophila montana]
MQEYYKITQQWRMEAASREQNYQEQLKQCQTQIDKINEENQQLKRELEMKLEQIHLVEDIHQKEHDELRQSVSEKSSLINNMRVEIDRLQKHQLNSYEYVPDESIVEPDYKKKSDEHECQVKDLQRQMSALLAENLEFKDMKKTYVDEIDCLKVNLTSAEELLNVMRADVNALKAKDAQKDDEITHLKTQIDIYRRDFEMERADREKNAGEKEQYLADLRALQRRNQELIEALAEANKSNKAGYASTPLGASKKSLRDEQRPVRVLDPTGAAARTSDSALRCPICSKSFYALTVLQSHVNDCLDKN